MTPRRLIEPARLASTAVLRGQSDERLVDLTRAGNARAFEAIVQRYRRPVLRYCARILPPGRAEDAVQQTFLSAYNAISTGDDELKLRPWLYRIARNASLNLLRQNGWNHEQLDEQFDGVLRPDQAVEGRERIQALVASVKRLPERQRDAIVLRELEGRSYEEIAVALGVTDGAVRQLLNRARTTLRAGATALTPYGLAERIAEIGGGAGGGVSLVKRGTAVLVAGAVATGGATQVVPGVGNSAHRGTASAHAAEATAARAATGGELTRSGHARSKTAAPGHLRANRREGERRHHDSSHRGRDGSSGGIDSHGGAMLVDDHSGSGEHSGSGTSGGDGQSGSGSGSSDGGGTSGSSGSSGSGSSGSGSTTSGGDGSSLSSGSGSSGSGSSGSGTSGGE